MHVQLPSFALKTDALYYVLLSDLYLQWLSKVAILQNDTICLFFIDLILSTKETETERDVIQ